MKHVGVRTLRAKAPRLVHEVEESGEPVTVTRHGRPVAKLVPHKDPTLVVPPTRPLAPVQRRRVPRAKGKGDPLRTLARERAERKL